ncbi:MAG TPA: aminopeptidase, partial [Longimicrobiales bacterium]|nr:aminopeptidase [Longimicrobiales bacterium]
GEPARNCQLARASWADNLLFGQFLSEFIAALEELYGRPGLSAADRIRLRVGVFDAARKRFETEVRPKLRTTAFRDFAQEPVNNATLIGTRLYYDRLHLFEAAFQKNQQNLPLTIEWIVGLARSNSGDPFKALAAALR